MNRSIVTGSLGHIAETEGMSIAETFLGAEAVVIVDVSGSMNDTDSRDGMSRYNVALEELAALQAKLPGKIAVIAFSQYPMFCPGGVPPMLGSMTNLAEALRFSRVADVGDIRFVVISDGQPDNEAEALREAKLYKNRIDVIYVGSENHPYGRDFLTKLAAASGGVAVTADRVKELARSVETLLLE